MKCVCFPENEGPQQPCGSSCVASSESAQYLPRVRPLHSEIPAIQSPCLNIRVNYLQYAHCHPLYAESLTKQNFPLPPPPFTACTWRGWSTAIREWRHIALDSTVNKTVRANSPLNPKNDSEAITTLYSRKISELRSLRLDKCRRKRRSRKSVVGKKRKAKLSL
jgi:hypothetical protein